MTAVRYHAGPGAAGCLSEVELLRLVGGELAEPERDAIDSHLDGCALCRMVCAELVRQRRSSATPAEDPVFASTLPVRAGGELGRDPPVVIETGHDLELDRQVVVVSLASVDPVARARFTDELRVAAKLEHAGIPGVMRSGTLDDGRPAYTLRRTHGRTFDDLMRSARRGERRGLIPAIARAVDAVAYGHAHQVVHGDLDGTAIIVGRHGEVVVERWGAWHRHHDPGDHRPDPRDDVRALGALLAQALGPTRRPPELASIIARCDTGYGSAGELADDLRRFLDGQLVATHVYTWRDRISRVIRQHRIAAGVLALSLIAAATVGTVALVGIRRDRDTAERIGRDADTLVDYLSSELARRLAADHRDDLIGELRGAIDGYRRDLANAARTDAR